MKKHDFSVIYTEYYEYDGGEMQIEHEICSHCGVESDDVKDKDEECNPE